MQTLLLRGSKGPMVALLRRKLAEQLGGEAALFGKLNSGDGFDADVAAAVRRWQTGVGLIADGIVGPRCMAVLSLGKALAPLSMPLTLGTAGPLFPATKPANVSRYLPYLAAALRALGLVDRPMLLAALGTIRAETEGFLPIAEMPSRFNTLPGAPPFSAYDPGTRLGKQLGNTQAGDGARFKGRGFVQLTGRDNYTRLGDSLGVDLTEDPDLANQPEIAALLLASFILSKRQEMQQALARNDLKQARQLVNGGSHGLDRFKNVFALAQTHWPALKVGVGKTRSTSRLKKSSAPRTAVRDADDLRDRHYMPPPVSLPASYPSAADIAKFLPRYRQAGLILDQGQEGACTGFGLACVINYLQWQQQGLPAKMSPVSPRMLYTMARRHDEYAGENYDGSSCRGALKGWFKHGVCHEPDWPYQGSTGQPRFGYAERARHTTLGVYYRIALKSITDMQAAIAQVGAVYVSAFTHGGWDNLPIVSKVIRHHDDLPCIEFDGHTSQSDGHAFALIGFNQRGFVLQNSWGPKWGAGGFAVLTYEDWLTHGMDAWVAALGVPGVVAGLHGAAPQVNQPTRAQAGANWWSEAQAYQNSVVLGNDGRVQRYLTEDERTRTLAHQVAVLPDLWFRSRPKAPRRLVIYAHGGLNKEADAIKRARALGPAFLDNDCYPLFMVWKTGLLESLTDILSDARSGDADRPGMAGAFSDVTDRLIEATIGRGLAKPLWNEMKENAQRAFTGGRGGEWLLRGLEQLLASSDGNLSIHLVGHSAGSIFLGHMLTALAGHAPLLTKVQGIHLYAPACTVAFANEHYAAQPQILGRTHLCLLSDRNELNDNTAMIYRKSLLYLVSNALEADRRTPLLGMHKAFLEQNRDDWDGTSTTMAALAQWQRAWRTVPAAQLQVITADKITTASAGPVQAAASHGGFDNDIEVLNHTLSMITGNAKLVAPVTDLRGF